MTLLDFARGPALEWSLIILVAGTFLRIVGTLLLRGKKDLSKPKVKSTAGGAIRTVFNRMWPRPHFAQQISFPLMMAYIMHIGLFVVVFLYGPHIMFIKDLTGLSWGALPSSLIYFSGAAIVATMIALMIRRLTNPVLRMISTFGDYSSWLVTLLPVVTGMMAVSHLGARYETMLALHLLSVELLFIWFPFSKLVHAIFTIPSRAHLGATFERRGVKI
ncbi:MAG: nitrate reductase [Gammaproteobacteria bacterium]|jgi:nitrate reductase gamma subunit